MHFSRILVLFYILYLGNPFGAQAQKEINENEARTLITLLDYIAKDYSGAVEDGQVVNEAEFEEISEFTETCISYHKNLVPQVNDKNFTDLAVELTGLKELIKNKEDQQSIDRQAKGVKEKILAMG